MLKYQTIEIGGAFPSVGLKMLYGMKRIGVGFVILKTNKPLSPLQIKLINTITEGSLDFINMDKIMDDFTLAATLKKYGVDNKVKLPLYYFIDYVTIDNTTYIVVDYTKIKIPGRVYFSSIHNALSAIDAVGEDKLIKYYSDLKSERIG